MTSGIRTGILAAAAAGVGALILFAGSVAAQSKPAPRSALAQRRIERGKYLVEIMACNDCHTPLKMGPDGPQPDMTRMLSGHPEAMKLPPPPQAQMPWGWGGTLDNTAFYGPWGISYSANLTPDKNTGIGAVWTEDLFVKAMRTGKHIGTSRRIQPPMPWPWIGKATDEDLKAIFAYLRSVPPIANHVPDWQEPPSAAAPPKAPTKK